MEYFDCDKILYSSKVPITLEEIKQFNIKDEEIFEMINLNKCFIPFRCHVGDSLLTKAISYITRPISSISSHVLPKKINDSVYPYQREGINKLLESNRALLADEMGLGKTIQSLAWANNISKKRVLIVCPASLLSNWKNEINNWLPGEPVQIISKDEDIIISAKYIIISLGLVNPDKKKASLLQDPSIDTILFDEAHSFINPESQRSKAVLCSTIPNMLFITGTPLLAKHIHLYVLIKMLYPEWKELTLDKYTIRYCDKHLNYWKQWDVSGSIRQKELFALLQKKMIRRFASDVLSDLPPLYSHIVTLSISDADLITYKQVLDKEIKISMMNACKTTGNLLKNIQMEKYRVTSNAKISIVPDYINSQIKQHNKKVIIWYHFDRMKDALINKFPQDQVLVIGGDTLPMKRQVIVNDFRNPDSKKRILILSLTACSTGLNICNAEEMYFADRGFTPAHELQAKKRAHRIGCTAPVNCYFPVAKGTYDERLVQTLNKKDKIVNSTMQEEKKLKMDSNTTYDNFKGIEFEQVGVSAPFARQLEDEEAVKPLVGESFEVWMSRVTIEEEFDLDKIKLYQRPEYMSVNQINLNQVCKWLNILEYDGVLTRETMNVLYSNDIPIAIFIKRKI
jgi:SWI/SNF-related matrix-associated actin-dependent regulator 1 of chromatin subfamily A